MPYERQTWWANFTKTIREEKYGQELAFLSGEWEEHRTTVLASYNAEYRDGCVHFETEQDATFFLLRWL